MLLNALKEIHVRVNILPYIGLKVWLTISLRGIFLVVTVIVNKVL